MDLMLRKTYRTQLTKIVNNVSELLSKNQINVEQIPVLIAKISSLEVKLSEVNKKLADTFDEDQLEAECEKIFEYEEIAVEAKAKLEQRAISEAKKSTNALDNVPRSSQETVEETNGGNQQNTHIVQRTVRLPKIDLIKFNGDEASWPAFWEQYSVAIHKNDELDEATKYTYLKSLVIGRAATTISGLTQSELSYNDAIELLKNEYANTDSIINNYIQQLMSINPVKNERDTNSLRNLYTKASTITRSLISLGVTADQYGLMVKSIIFNALPYNLKVEYNRQKIKKGHLNDNISENGSIQTNSIDYNQEIQDLLRFLKIELDALERAEPKDRDPKRKLNMCETGSKQKADTCTAAGLLANVKNYCLFCDRNSHDTKDCRGSKPINEKKDILKRNGCCFRCLKKNHNSKFCKTKISCAKCKLRHATSICDPINKQITKLENQREKTATVTNTISNATVSSQNETTTNLLTNGRIDDVYLQTGYAKITGNGLKDNSLVRLIIDGGSQLTFIKESLSKRMGLPVIGTNKLSIMPFGSKSRTPSKFCNQVKLSLKSQYNNDIIEISAVEVPEICFDALKTPSRKNAVIQRFASQHQLADVNITQLPTHDGIGVLIGADHYWKLVTGEIQRITDDLTAVNTKLGWTLHGSSNESDSYNFLVATTLTAQIKCEDDQLRRFWDLETIGINGSEKGSNNFSEHYMKNNIVFKNERYEVSLPWKTDKVDSHYQGAVARLKTLTSKLIKNKRFNEYDKAIREYLTCDCAERIPIKDNPNKTYYLPHEPVYRDDKETTKVRVVFDASAHSPGFPSLSDVLFCGDNLVPDLMRILMNFRIGSIGIIADIEKAFLQISLREEDRDSHRFLWYQQPIEDGISSTTPLPQVTEYRMKRVTFGVTTSPFILAVTLKKHFKEQPEEHRKIAEKLSNAFYVDDMVIAENSKENARQLYQQSKKILRSANMNLRKWYTNDVVLMKEFHQEETPNAETNRTKVLGIEWQLYSDELSVDMNSILNDAGKIPTKRNVLQKIAKIFDPIGILAPYTINAKILLQRVWKEKFDWDQVISVELQTEWHKWCMEISDANDVRVRRGVVSTREDEVELHIFADASPHAYGVVAYIKFKDTCQFLMAKNRVSPISQNGQNELTLPKLELTAALCAANLYHYIKQNIRLNIKCTTLWSDSKITLNWIKGRTTKWKPYVQNRVNEIRRYDPENWRYCPGKENPADLVTRGITIKKLTETPFWFEGPSWLKQSPDNWPSDEDCQMAQNTEISTQILLSTSDRKQKREQLFSLERFSNIEKVYRITAYVKRFIHNLRYPNEKYTGELKVYEVYQAEMYWIRSTQGSEFSEEVMALLAGKPLSSKSSILTLNPFLDEDRILRLGGRLTEAELPYQTKHPIILPKRSTLTDRIIYKEHENVLHGGVNVTLAAIRKRYWIIQVRQRIKTITGGCLKCKKLKSKPGNQPFAPVPANRLKSANPFKITGVDFAGPLYVPTENGKAKTYIMLLTCAVVRAVHLELVPDLTTESCIRALRRFIARRGIPEVIYSDNAKTFHRTSQELEALFAIMRSSPVQEMSRSHRIEWKFIVERAAWWGGFWERMVKTVKGALKITLGRASVNSDELQTILTEVEASVNSRPLTYIDDDVDNLLILSPSHFLIGPTQSGLMIDIKAPELNRNDILRQWKMREKLTTKFWNRWSSDYLQQLRSFHHTTGTQAGRFAKGDVALLYDQAVPRLLWKLVRIQEVFIGRDGKVRACEIQTAKGVRLRRPIQLLYPLEINSGSGEDVENCKPSEKKKEGLLPDKGSDD